jgi:hypothetical protein
MGVQVGGLGLNSDLDHTILLGLQMSSCWATQFAAPEAAGIFLEIGAAQRASRAVAADDPRGRWSVGIDTPIELVDDALSHCLRMLVFRLRGHLRSFTS